jgi:hypothetical protein
MQPQDLEPEMEELLLRIVPNLAEQWRGAPPEEIAQIEEIAGRPLPLFYRWFLLRMGHELGPLIFRSLQFSAPTVLACYAERIVPRNPRFLMIGYDTDEMNPLHLFYDFNYPARDDARVVKQYAHTPWETFREMLAWGQVGAWSVDPLPQKCCGALRDHGGDALGQLEPVMKSLGFETPIQTGRCCGIYLRADAAMVTTDSLDMNPGTYPIFRLGAQDQGRIRQILGEIVAETSLELKILEWDPPL